MAINPAGAVCSTLDVFGSWVTEMSPDSQPEGVSSDNQDCIFSPGQVGGRPALQKVYASPIANTTAVGGKSFVTPTGDIKNLTYYSNGALYVEDLTNNPGVQTLLFQSTPGTFYKSITEFGREWIAISDGLHGQESPLQYDGDNIDRVTQDGPAVAPQVTNLIIPPTTLTTAPPLSATITNINPVVLHMGIYSNAIVSLAGPNPFPDDVPVIISGTSNAAMNATWTTYLLDPVGFPNAIGIMYSSSVNPLSTGGAIVTASTTTLVRNGNVVSGNTSSAHGLQVGFLAQISGITAFPVGGGIASIVINNEDLPGIATITTNSAHGLVPQNFVNIDSVPDTLVGTSIVSSTTEGYIFTVIMTTAHGLTPGQTVTVHTTGGAIPIGTWTVLTTPDANTFTYEIPGSTLSGTSSAGGTVDLVFPLASTNPVDNVFQVVECPSATTFQVAISYSDGTWSGGNCSFAWDGTFYITAVPTATSFQYQQYGPDATTAVTGTVTPTGQAAPGKHQLRYSFLTRQGALTKPSPWVTFVANGGQYLNATFSVGPSNIVGRVLQFTGALGSKFFYIPVPAQVNGQIVSTATQINDNTTTSVLLDFSDNSLFAGLATSIPGNNLPAQLVLEGALGFGSYGSRLLTYGQRNTVQNLLAMSFDAGPNPTGFASGANGWSRIAGEVSGQIIAGHILNGWQIAITNDSVPRGTLFQPAYQNQDASAIIQPNLHYTFRAWFQPTTATASDSFVAVLSSASTSYTSTATILLSAMTTAGGFVQANFSLESPAIIPSDLLLTISASGAVATNLIVDEMSIIYADTPFLDTIIYGSYVNNAEGFDGLTGKFGASQDTRKVMDFGVLRNNLYLLTQDPSGRIHETSDNGITEPSGWTVNEVASNCGALSAFSVTKSQADDGSASGGEEWFSWASESGARIFGGDNPYKISQEIQPNWFEQESPAALQINMAAALTVFAINDPVQRVIYYGLPIGSSTAPSLLYPMNYRELDSSYAIASSPPYHPSLAGKLVATDNTRKWTRWNLPMNGMARMYRNGASLTMVFFGGNGSAINSANGFGNIYTLNPTKYTDDDYGQINPYYVTYFLPSPEEEQALQLDAGRKMIAYITAYVSAISNLTIQILCDRLGNPWPLSVTRQPGMNPNFDLESGGGYAQAQRMALKIYPTPAAGQTDNTFGLSRVSVWFRKSRLSVRGAAQ